MKMHTWQIENGRIETNYDNHTTATTLKLDQNTIIKQCIQPNTTHFTPQHKKLLFNATNKISKMYKNLLKHLFNTLKRIFGTK